jgi:hypothetical protein
MDIRLGDVTRVIHGNLAAMIRNGLYSVVSKVLDGIEGNSIGVSVVQDGTMRGGGSIYYHVGSYTCSNGKWKGELTVREHEPAQVTELFARKVVTMGFMGTYNDDGAEFEATALVGKRSARLKMVLRLLIPDQADGEVR